MSFDIYFEKMHKSDAEVVHLTVVRLTTERFKRGSAYFTGKSLKVMKRLSKGWDILNEEVQLMGVYEFFDYFYNDIQELSDGLYVLEYDGLHKCYETGHQEYDGYKLTPYRE